MPSWLSDVVHHSSAFMAHGHCYLWLPGLLVLHVLSDALIGTAYVAISLLLYIFVRKIRLPFSPVFVAFGLFIGLCGLTHFMAIWTVWNPDYLAAGVLKAATAGASVATALGLFFIRRQVEEVVHATRLSEERRAALQQKNAELERLYQRMTELNRAQTNFFANVSHELRTPLALIMGPAEQLLASAELPESLHRHVESIRHNSQTLLRQVDDLLEIAKLDLQGQTPRFHSVDLVSLFERFIAQVRSAAEGRQIDVDFKAPAELSAETDPYMVERVVLNLLGNAVKFTPEGGHISLTLEPAASGFRLVVEDSGPGIAPADRERLFERFAQGADTERGRLGGTGLGLAIVKQFVEVLGGQIAVDTSPEGGARFNVWLPAAAPVGAEIAAAVSTAGSAPAPLVLAKPTPAADAPAVLVVEDTAQLAQLICEVLSERYRVQSARSGREALAQAIALRPDLIITDLMIPDLDGASLVAELRRRAEFSAVPIMVLTARADDAMRVRLLEGGAQDYLAKPFLPRELLARTENLLAMKRAGDTLRSALNEASSDVADLAQQLAARHRELQLALETTEIARAQALLSSRAKSSFLGLISHEIRTPLSIIQLCAELLAESETGPAEAAARDRLLRATRQLAALMTDVLTYVRADTGQMQPQWQPVDMVALAEEAVAANQVLITRPEVMMAYRPSAEPIPMIRTDPRLVRIIINNLLTNAIKFTESGNITLRLEAEPSVMRCIIEDTGIGIAQEDLTRIFEPFGQLEPVRRKSIAGVGLGLTLTRELAHLLHGEVNVTSQPGTGSVFTLCLPIAPPAAPDTAADNYKAEPPQQE